MFAYENPPGTRQFSGSQDALGIVLPGLKRLDYRGDFWPEKIHSVRDEKILRWLERNLSLITLGPRAPKFEVCDQTRVTPARARRLAAAAEACWTAISEMDLPEFGRAMRDSFDAQVAIFPSMVDRKIRATIKQYAPQALGWKLAGAGGSGYLVLVSQAKIPCASRIKIHRASL